MQALFERDTDLSIIVPVYNLEHFINPLLRSLKKQDLGGYKVEYIFVLNNCTDDSEAVLRASGLECRILNCTQQGCGPARNMGLEEARGKYVWFIDGDDWLISYTAIKDILDKAYAEELDIMLLAFGSYTFRKAYFSMVWQYLFRRSFIADLRFPDIQPREDDVFMEQVLALVGKTVKTYRELPTFDTPVYYYNYLRVGSNMYRFYKGEQI